MKTKFNIKPKIKPILIDQLDILKINYKMRVRKKEYNSLYEVFLKCKVSSYINNTCKIKKIKHYCEMNPEKIKFTIYDASINLILCEFYNTIKDCNYIAIYDYFKKNIFYIGLTKNNKIKYEELKSILLMKNKISKKGYDTFLKLKGLI